MESCWLYKTLWETAPSEVTYSFLERGNFSLNYQKTLSLKPFIMHFFFSTEEFFLFTRKTTPHITNTLKIRNINSKKNKQKTKYDINFEPIVWKSPIFVKINSGIIGDGDVFIQSIIKL